MTYDDTNPADTVAASAGEAFKRGDNIFEYNEAASLSNAYTGARYGALSRPFRMWGF